jgi:hypothetical protein
MLFVLAFTSVVWLGSLNARMVIGGDLLEPGTLEFDPLLSPSAERELFRILSMTALITAASYLGVLVSAALFLWHSPWRPRQHGWMMISAILLFGFVPVEIYAMTIDLKMVYLEFFTTATNEDFRVLFLERLGALGGAPFIALLSYYTILGLAAFQPMRRISGDPP